MARVDDAATSSDNDDLSIDFLRSHAQMLQNKQVLANNVLTKRKEQLHKWENSEMNNESTRRKNRAKVQFQDSDIFLSACMSGDEEEVDELLAKGADINTSTVDGLTALHQSVIDSHPEMVRFLCMRGADVNAQDNEGWTPLHAAACCGNTQIVQLLLDNGADLQIINSDKELPLDLAEDEACREALAQEYRKQGIEPDDCRDEEERTMKRDAEAWLRDGICRDAPHWRTGAWALHVAAAKGYTQVMELLLKAGASVTCRDREGWTPLHAAAHWGERDACKILMEHGASLAELNNAGQNVLSVADKEVVEYLEELQRSYEKRTPSAPHTGSVLSEQNARVSETPPVPPSPAANGHRQSSVPHIMSTEEKHALAKRDERDENAAQVARRLSGERERPASSPDKVPAKSNGGTESGESSERSSIASSSASSTASSASAASNKSKESSVESNASGSVSGEEMSERSSVERSTASESSQSVASGKGSVSSTESSASKGSSLGSGDQNVAVTIKRPPPTWISRTREAEVKSPDSAKVVEPPSAVSKTVERPATVSSTASEASSAAVELTTAVPTPTTPSSKPLSPTPSRPLSASSSSPSVQRSTSTPNTLPWSAMYRTVESHGISNTSNTRHIGQVIYPPFLANQRVNSAFRPVAPGSPTTARLQPPPPAPQTPPTPQWNTTPNRTWQTPPTIPTSSRESEAERRKESRIQRVSRRSTQGVTKEQLAEAREYAERAEELKSATSARPSTAPDAGSGASSVSAASVPSVSSRESSTRTASATFIVPPKHTNPAVNSDRNTWSTESSHSSEKSSTTSSEEPNEDKRKNSQTSLSSEKSLAVGLTIPLPNAAVNTPSANNLRRKSQGLGFNRTNRRGTGPVALDDLQEARQNISTVPPVIVRPTTMLATVTPTSTSNTVSSTMPWEKSFISTTRLSTVPRTTSFPDRTTAYAPQTQSSSGGRPSTSSLASPSVGVARQSGPYSPTVHTPTTYTTPTAHVTGAVSCSTGMSSLAEQINYKTLYEAEKKENEKLKAELDDMRSRTASQENGSTSGFRRVANRYSTSKEGTPLSSVSKSSSVSSLDEQQKRAFERRIAELEYELKGLSQLRLENQRLKEENGALVRVISKMTL